MGISSDLCAILRDYCLHSSLAGLGYIANKKYHFTERLFWLFCFLASVSGSYYLISNFMATYRTNAISMVVETVNPQDVNYFPSVGICEMGYSKEIYSRLEDIIEGLKLDEDTEYNYDVEDFLLRVIFHNLYNYGSITSYCTPYRTCDDCIRCPLDNYQEYADKVSFEQVLFIMYAN
jgi:acid-sensing ion channel, other